MAPKLWGCPEAVTSSFYHEPNHRRQGFTMKDAGSRATAHLRMAISRAHATGEHRLRTIVQLAREAGCSVVTMHRAVQKMVTQGALRAHPRKGIEVIALPEQPCTNLESALPRKRSAAILEKLRHDIATATFGRNGNLPAYKELCVRYGAAYTTVRKSMESLQHDGIVERYGRGFRVQRTAPLQTRNRMVLVNGGLNDGSMGLFSPRTAQMMAALEYRCHCAGLELSVVTCYAPEDMMSGDMNAAEALRAAKSPHRCIGIMIWLQGMTLWGTWTRKLLQQCFATGLPISLLDENGEGELFAPRHLNRSIQLLAWGWTQECGRHVGRYLLEKGHRNIAYLSLYHGNRWSRERLKGLRSVCARLAPHSRVYEYTSQRWLHPREPIVQNPAVQTVPTRQIQRLADQCQGGTAARRAAVLQSLIPYLDNAIMDATDSEAYQEVFNGTDVSENCTVLVFASEATAVHAVSALNAQGKRIPADCSIVTFDDGYLSMLHKLTSYNFNAQAVVDSMVNFCLSGARRRRVNSTSTPPSISSAGRITERGSVQSLA